MNVSRTFTQHEQSFLHKVVEKLPADESRSLMRDIKDAISVTEEGDFVGVELRDYRRPGYAGHRNLRWEGKLYDKDGGPVSVLVNLDQNERLLELEYIWWSSPSGTHLDWSTQEIVPGDRIGR